MKTYFELPEFSSPSAIAIGTFDGCHRGHQAVIRQMQDQARKQNLKAVVLSFQNHPLSYLAPERMPLLLSSCREKELALAALQPTHAILLPFNETLSRLSPETFVHDYLVKHLKAKHISVGFNFRFGHQARGTPEYLQALGKEFGFSVDILPPFQLKGEIVNSSRVRSLLQQGNLSEARDLLGDGYLIAGRVIRGQGIASRVLGIPTANLGLETSAKLLPPHGVYACTAQLKDAPRPYQAVMNLGMRPTFSGVNLSLEVYIMDFSGDLYEQEIQIRLQHFLRPEQRFENPDALKKQIQRDILQARTLLEAPT